MRRSRIHSGQGFTLVEVVLAVVITSIVATIVLMFMHHPVQGYFDSEARAELTDTADTALRRMARDLRLALPNSIRTTTAGGNQYIEFLLTKTGGRYLAEEDNPTTGNVLNFADDTKLTFDVVGAMPTDSQTIVEGDYIVVYNLGPGFAPSDAYDCTTSPGVCNRALVDGVAGNTIAMHSNPFAMQAAPAMTSPGRQFQVVTGAVTYVCNPTAGTLTRYWGYGIVASQPNNAGVAPLDVLSPQASLAKGVAACNFSYDNAAGSLASQRSGLAGLSLTLRSPNGEQLTLFHQVHVDNTP